MKDRVQATEFWDRLSMKLTQSKSLLQSAYDDSSKYTQIITKTMEEIGVDLGYHVSKEYWPRVDVSFFSNETDQNWAKWAREVAIELENGAGSWTEEIDKLFCINAGLKVLVTYWDKSDSEVLDFLQNDFLAIYKSRKYLQQDDTYLIVFGPLSTSTEARLDFSAFLFDGISSKQLSRKKIFT